MEGEQSVDDAVRLHVYRFFLDEGRPPVPVEAVDRRRPQACLLRRAGRIQKCVRLPTSRD